MSELLYSVRNVFDTKSGYLKGKHDKYNIPIYQRGYKWTSNDVEILLNDIHKFNDDDEKFYCLQNITIVPEDKNACFNVVDGQQRLTTLSIILSHLNEKNLVRGRLEYSIRKNTHEFLSNFVFAENCEPIAERYSNWDGLIKEYPDYDHQDIFYIYQASQTVQNWLSERENEKGFSIDIFKNKLLDKVQFIVNNVGAGNEEKIFGNLNSKRIPLDGADLVRAILITRVAKEESSRDDSIKGIVHVNEYRIKIGWQLDAISAWWADKSVKEYFQSIISISNDAKENFDLTNYPLNTLLMLYAEKEDKSSLSLKFIENEENATQLYKNILKLHQVLKDWYRDKEIYHYLGLLFAKSKKNKFKDIWNIWINKCEENEDLEIKSRQDFINVLKDLLFNKIYGEEVDFDNVFSYTSDWYTQDTRQLTDTLLLLDIIDVQKKSAAFLPVSSFDKTNNDVEHIFPQTPRTKTSKEMVSYLNYLNKYLAKDEADDILEKFSDSLWLHDEEFTEEVNSFISKTTKKLNIHSIGNLVLLNSSLNRSLKNNPYSVKRVRVIKYYNEDNKKNYVQPHTFKVFTRYFATSAQEESYDLEHWGQKDIKLNNDAVKETVMSFFMSSIKKADKQSVTI